MAEKLKEWTGFTSIQLVATNVDLCRKFPDSKQCGTPERKMKFGKYASLVLSTLEEQMVDSDDPESNTNTHWLSGSLGEHGFKVLPRGLSFWFAVTFGSETEANIKAGDSDGAALKSDTPDFSNNLVWQKWTGLLALEVTQHADPPPLC